MTQAIQLKILDARIGDTIPLPTYATHGSAGSGFTGLYQ